MINHNIRKIAFLLQILGLFVSVAIGGIIFSILAYSTKDFKADELALGDNTSSHIEFFEGALISEICPIKRLYDSYKVFNDSHNVILWLGGSQLHAINYYEKGDRLAVGYANDSAKLRNSMFRYLQVSTPNANYHDLLAIYLSFRQKGLLPDLLLIAIVYDDLKDVGIQERAISNLEPIDQSLITKYGTGVANISEEYNEWSNDSNDETPIERTATSNTPQDFLEDGLITLIEKAWFSYKHRGTLASFIKVKGMAFVKNSPRIVEAKPSVIRVNDFQKKWSNQALESLIKLAHDDNVKLILYEQPQRSELYFDVKYDRKGYNLYFDWIVNKCDDDNVYFADFENIVADEEFGLNNWGNPDNFHFRNMGHKILGTMIDEYISKNFMDGSNNVIQ